MSIISSTGIQEAEPITHPDSDGKRMADNTKQHDWIQLIEGNLTAMFAGQPDVFIAGDLLWYPDKHSEESAAPDVMLVFGRPKGHRGSYKQWLEDEVPVTVAFEIRSPCNDDNEMAKKFYFYDEYGVEEYYIYDPDANKLEVFVRGMSTFRQVHDIPSHVSRRLGIRFEMTQPEMTIYRPNGKRFVSIAEKHAEAEAERSRADEEERRADEEERRADEEKRRADEEERRADEEKRLGDEARREAEKEKRRGDEAERRGDEARRRAEEAERQTDEAKRQSNEDKRRADEAERQANEVRRQSDEVKRLADAAISGTARLKELSRKVRRGQASAEEVAELERLEGESA